MKRFLASLALLLAFANPAHAALAQIVGSGTGGNVASGSGSATTTQATTALNTAVGAGNIMVVNASMRSSAGGPSITSCSDTQSNTWTAAAASVVNGTVVNRVFYTTVTTPLTTSDTVSCLFNNTSVRKYLAVLAFTNPNASPLDAAGTTGNGAGTTISVGPTGTLACPGGGAGCEVVIAGTGYDSGSNIVTSESTGFTAADTGNDRHLAFQIVGATTAITYAPTVTAASRSWAVSLIGIEAAASGVVVHSMSLLGVGK